MGITYQGIESMGFEKINEKNQIKAKFYSLIIFAIKGLKIYDESIVENHNIVSASNKYKIYVGNSINEIFKEIFNDVFVEDESKWASENKVKPPYIVLKYELDDVVKGKLGYWLHQDEKIFTYDCFRDDIKYLDELDGKYTSAVISLATVHLSKMNKDVEIKKITKEIFGISELGITINEFDLDISINASIQKDAHHVDIADIFSKVTENTKSFPARVATLLYSGLSESDNYKKFLFLFQALELFTHKTFDKLKLEDYVNSNIAHSDRLLEVSKKFWKQKIDECKNLKQRFILCSLVGWSDISNDDINSFEKIKKCRDQISHGENIKDEELPIDELKKLIFKIMAY